MQKRKAEKVQISIITFIIILLCLSITLPFWFLLVDSFSTVEFSEKLGLKLFPNKISFESYKHVLSQKVVGRAYFNTIMRTVVGTPLSILVTFCAAYPLSKKDLPFRKAIMTGIMFTMFFSGGIIPTYILIKNLHLINRFWVLVLPTLCTAYNIVIIRNFMYSIPESLEESAYIDGAKIFTVLFRIVAPLSIPVIATVTLWVSVMHWNAWFDAMIYITDPNKIVLQILIRKIVLETQQVYDTALIDASNAINLYTEKSIRATTLFVSIGPIIIVYPFIQKYFIKGIMLGSVKG